MGKIYAYILSTVAIVGCVFWLYHSAYYAGYEAHRLETESKAAQTIITARTDVMKANEEVKKAECKIEERKTTNALCGDILSFDLTPCLGGLQD